MDLLRQSRGRPKKGRLSTTETIELRAMLREALRGLGMTQSGLNARLCKKKRWASNFLNRGTEATQQDALDVATWIALPSQLPRHLRDRAKVTAWHLKIMLEAKPSVPFAPMLVLERDVNALAHALAEYLKESGIDVAEKVFRNFFTRKIHPKSKQTYREGIATLFAQIVEACMKQTLVDLKRKGMSDGTGFKICDVPVTPDFVGAVIVSLEAMSRPDGWRPAEERRHSNANRQPHE